MQIHSFLTSVLDEGEWSVSHPDCFKSIEKPQYPLKRLVYQPHSPSEHFGEDKNPLSLPGF
jgi:hypothetical protein